MQNVFKICLQCCTKEGMVLSFCQILHQVYFHYDWQVKSVFSLLFLGDIDAFPKQVAILEKSCANTMKRMKASVSSLFIKYEFDNTIHIQSL